MLRRILLATSELFVYDIDFALNCYKYLTARSAHEGFKEGAKVERFKERVGNYSYSRVERGYWKYPLARQPQQSIM
jgi:hypothetical protein